MNHLPFSFILGGAGFIGSSLSRNMSKFQNNFLVGDLQELRDFPKNSCTLDIRKREDLIKYLQGDVVVNLAAIHRDDITDLDEYHLTNVQGAKNLCQVCEEKNINKIVFTSSVAVYGFNQSDTDEKGAINPFNEYGRTKAIAEDIYRNWREKDPENRSLIIVRPTVVFGEGNRGNVYNLLNQINSGAFAMIGDGKNKKSMAYVENLSTFLLHCIISDKKYAVYNYVDKPDLTMNQLVIMVRKRLLKKSFVGFRIPKSLGILAGYLADLLAKFGIKLPISSIRIKKFCASSEFSSAQEVPEGFEAPFTLQEGMEKTIESEFIDPDPNRQIFFTE
tara:strand:- start:1962 stop:2960 length:999 start_codon:yes stop_codon:yes gene_type:complete